MTDTLWWKMRWDGPGWRWWSLLAGCALVLVSVVLAILAGLMLGEKTTALLTIILMAELFVLCMTGSGLLMSTTRRMSRGGLQRETATIDIDHRPPDERKAERQRDQERRDRHTIRTAIVTLPTLVTFIALLAW